MIRSNRSRWSRIVPTVVWVASFFSSAAVYSATPSVLAGGHPYTGTYGFDSVQSPTTPLEATYNDAVGSNTVFGNATPGKLKASSKIVDGADYSSQSLGKAEFTDHFYIVNPGLPDNSSAAFLFRFTLGGIMKIKADVGAVSAVSINAYGPGEDPVGYLEVSQSGSTARLYGIGGEGGGPYPLNNIFAEADGSMKVYQTETVDGGYFTFSLSLPVSLIIPSFPVNKVPSVDDVSNQVIFILSAISFKDAESDFSATFEFTEQNPLVPSPFGPSLPATGWVYSSSSGEIDLPSPLTIATATGTGDAAFGSEFGLIESLTALDETSFPDVILLDGEFPHGFFSFDVTDLETGAVIGLGINLPAAVAPGTKWWFKDPGTGWHALPTIAVGGTGFLSITASDDLAGDFDPTSGTISVLGGPGVFHPLFADGFEDGDTGQWSGP